MEKQEETLWLDLKLHLPSTWGLTKAFTSLLFFLFFFFFYWYCGWKSQVMQFWPTDFTCQFICWDHKKGAVNRSYGQRPKQRPTLYFTCVEGLSYNLQNFKCKISIDLRRSWKSWSQDCPVVEKKKEKKSELTHWRHVRVHLKLSTSLTVSQSFAVMLLGESIIPCKSLNDLQKNRQNGESFRLH